MASPSTAVEGWYAIAVTATSTADSAYAASASAVEMLVTPLQINLSTDKPSYSRNAWVTITALVTGKDDVSG